MGLINDNFIGYLDAWIYQNEITWMEKTVATPYWTGMTLFSIDRRHTQRRHQHNQQENIYESRRRVLFKGRLLYTSDAADEEASVDLGGCRIIKKKT